MSNINIRKVKDSVTKEEFYPQTCIEAVVDENGDALGIDASPTDDSDKLVRSGGVKAAIDGEASARANADSALGIRIDGANIGIQAAMAAVSAEQQRAVQAENAKYVKPAGGIPKADLASDVQASLDLAQDVVYDISAHNNNTAYASLAAALGNGGANIPQSLRKGGMSVRFVLTSDNNSTKYVQYRLMKNEFSTDVDDWQGVDDELTAGSDNLTKSGGIDVALKSCDVNVENVTVPYGQAQTITKIRSIKMVAGRYYKIKAVMQSAYTSGGIRLYNNEGTIVTFQNFDNNGVAEKTYSPSADIDGYLSVSIVSQSTVGSTALSLSVVDVTEETVNADQYTKIEQNNFLVNSTSVFESYIASIEVYLKDGADASYSNLYINYVSLSNGEYKVALRKVSNNDIVFRKFFTGQPAEIWAEMIGNVGFVHITFRGYPTAQVVNSDATKNILSKSCFKHLTAPSDIRNAISFSDYVPINNNTDVTSIDANYKAFCKAIHGIKVYNLSRDKSIVISALKRYTNGNYLINIKDLSTNVVTQFGPQLIEDKVISLQYGDAIIRLWIDWSVLTLDYIYAGYEIPIDLGMFEPSVPLEITGDNNPDAPFVLFDASRDYTENGYITATGAAGSDSQYVHSDYLKVTPLHTYVVSMDAWICAYTASKTVISGAGSQGGQGLGKEVVFTAPANCEYIIVSGKVVMEGRDKSYLKVMDYNHTYADIKGCDLLKWKPLNGKKVVVFADSIAGLNRAGWPLKLEERTGARVYNCGFPGCRMEAISTDGTMDSGGTDPFAMCNLVDAIHDNDWSFQEASPLLSGSEKDYYQSSLDLLKTIDFSDVDIVLIAYGTNEVGWLPMDDENDPDSKNTYAGATRYSLNRLMADYPNISVFLLTPIYRYSWGDSDTSDSDTHVHPTKGGTLIDNIDTLKEVAHEYKVPCIDMYYELGINIVNRANYYLDGTHLNNNGLVRYADRVAACIC